MSKPKFDDRRAVKAVDEALAPQDGTITLSTGVVLRAKQANPLVLIKVMASYPRPTPPLFLNKQMGREMENPDDPNYIEALQSWKMEYSDAMVSAMILLGTELVSKPKGMAGPDDDRWIEEYRLLVKEVQPNNASWRYLNWVQFKAIQNEKDMEFIKEVVGRLSGVRESAVKSAEDFPGSDEE